VEIIQARTDHQYEQAEKLFQKYADLKSIDLAYQGFEEELQALQQMGKAISL